jgi:hypothetical protein
MATVVNVNMALDEQRERLKEWHTKTHVMHVAHTKAAAREERTSKALGVSVAILTAITGTTLYTTWGESPSVVAQVIVAVIALAGVTAAAVQTALSPGKHSAEHREAGVQYGKLRRLMEEWRIAHPDANAPDERTLEDWLKSWMDIEASAPVVSKRELAHAEERIARQHGPEDPW